VRPCPDSLPLEILWRHLEAVHPTGGHQHPSIVLQEIFLLHEQQQPLVG